MKKMYFGMTVDDVALDGWCKPTNFQHLIEFLQKEGVPATFHVVPIDEATDKPFYTLSDRYIPIIQEAAAAGYNFEQHGLRHNRFELGVPPMMVLDLPHETENKRYAQENREFLEKDHSVANCRARLRQGRDILEQAFGFEVTGFRAPALQESPGMYQALKEEGYQFDGSTVLQETGWDYIVDKMDVPRRDINLERYEALRKRSLYLTLPQTCDYTWFVTKEKYGAFMELAKEDFRQCLACGIPFITVCHVDPVHEGEGLRFLHELFDFARETAAANGLDLEFATMKQLGAIINH